MKSDKGKKKVYPREVEAIEKALKEEQSGKVVERKPKGVKDED